MSPARTRRLGRPLAIGAAALALGLAVLPPLGAVALELSRARGALALLSDARLWALCGRSVGLAGVVTLLALAAGVPLGVLFARARIPWRRTLFALHVCVAFLPPFLPALGWFHVFGQEGLLGGPGTSRILFGPVGLVLVLAACFTPVVTALTALGVSGVDPSLEEAGRIVAGPVRVAAGILVPAARPAIVLGAVVVFALAFSELGVPMFLRVDVYPAVAFSRLGGMDFAPGEAAVLGLPLVALALVLLWLERRFAGRRAISTLGHRRVDRPPLFTGAARRLAAALAALAAISSMAPLFALAGVARGTSVGEIGTWLGTAPLNGLIAATAAAGTSTAVALVAGHALARGERAGVLIDGLSVLAFLLPSSILGVGLISAWNRPATNWVYATAAILVVGYVARYTAVATRVFASTVVQIPESLEQAARVVGSGYSRRLLSIVAALGRTGLGGAFALAFVFCLRDLEMAALFYPPGGEPLTVRIFTLEANGPPSVVAALALVHVLVTLGGLGLLAAGARWSRLDLAH